MKGSIQTFQHTKHAKSNLLVKKERNEMRFQFGAMGSYHKMYLFTLNKRLGIVSFHLFLGRVQNLNFDP